MSSYQITNSRRARKDLELLAAEFASRILPKIEGLSIEPRPPGCVKLANRTNEWRIRIGDYRVIYSIDDTNLTVTILAVRHRSKAYD